MSFLQKFGSVFFMLLVGLVAAEAQEETKEALLAQKAEKQAQLDALSGEIADIDAKIEAIPGWRTGAFGTLGFNLSSFDNWIKGANPNSTSSTILAAMNGYANLIEDGYFWRNSGGLNLGWQKLDTNTDGENTDYQKVADVLKITSLFGKNLSPKLALSALGEFNTAVLTNFNDPGILDLGVGFTWLPIDNMVVVVHPLNYHWVFGDNPEFGSALGAKVVVDYSQKILGKLNWTTNLTSFLAYKDSNPSLNEWTWTNGLAFDVLNGIGVGVNFAIRNAAVESSSTQNYFVVGLTYSL